MLRDDRKFVRHSGSQKRVVEGVGAVRIEGQLSRKPSATTRFAGRSRTRLFLLGTLPPPLDAGFAQVAVAVAIFLIWKAVQFAAIDLDQQSGFPRSRLCLRCLL